MSLDNFDPHEHEEREEMQGTEFRPQRTSSDEPVPLKTPMQLFLEEINEFPLLTASLEKKLAELKDAAGPFFQQQAGILEQAILESLVTGHAGRQGIIEALERIKTMILRREDAMVGGRQARGGAQSSAERDGSADAAFRRMVRASRNKRTFDPMLLEADTVTDDVFTRNLFAVMQKHVGLCQRIATSDIEEVAALASITRESFTLLRGALPADHSALQALAERDAAFEEEVAADEECRSYLTPLLQQRALASIGVTTPQDILMRANLRLVVSIARGYMGKGLELPDLIEEGNLGLYRAIDGFKTSKNVRFSTYASYWIKQSMKRALINQSHEVRLPAYVTELVSKWRQTSKRLHDQLGREPSEEEVQAELKLPTKKLRIVKRALEIAGAQFQREGDPDAAGEMSVAEMIEGHDPSAPDQMAQDDESDLVSALLDKLDPREAQVIRLRFPQDGSEPKTLLEIGELLGITRERVRQIESEALLALRNAASDVPEEEETETTPAGTGRRGRPPKSAMPVGALGALEAEALLDSEASTGTNGIHHGNGQFSDNGSLRDETDTQRDREDAPTHRLTEEVDRVPSPSFTSPPMPRRSPDAEPKRQNLSPEEKSVVQQNVQALIDQHTLPEVIRRIREKGGYTDGAARQAIRSATKGSGISPKYVSDLEEVFGVNVVAGDESQPEPRKKEEEEENEEPERAEPQHREVEQTAIQEEVLAQEVQLTETYRRKLAEALKVSLVRNAEGKVVFRIAQTDVEPV